MNSAALQTLINLGYAKEEAAAALKQGNELIANAFYILRANAREL